MINIFSRKQYGESIEPTSRFPFVAKTIKYSSPEVQEEIEKIPDNLIDFKNRIARNETSIIPENEKYSFRQPSGNKSIGDALGKYQITEGELKTYAPRFIGRQVTTDEFLNSPDIQERYLDEKFNFYSKQGYSPSEISWIHRRGITNAYNPGDERFLKDEYVEKFNQPIDLKKNTKNSSLKNISKKQSIASIASPAEIVSSAFGNLAKSTISRIAINLEKQFGPRRENETEEQYIERVSGPVIGAVSPLRSVGGVAQELKTPLSKLLNAIRSAGKPQKELALEQTAERARRASAVEETFEAQKGERGFAQALGQLKGELTKRPQFESLRGGAILESEAIEGTIQKVALDDFERAKSEILTELELSEKGYRYMDETSMKMKGVSSTFPKWIPEELRSKNLFESVSSKMTSGEVLGSKEQKLFNEIEKQIFSRMEPKLANEIGATRIAQAESENIKLNQLDIDNLFNQVQSHENLDVYDKVAASNGLNKILNGELPQPSQTALLEEIFGSDLVKALNEKRPAIDKIKDFVTEVLNIPRALITSFDMSSVLRQGVLLTTTKPKAAISSLSEMFKQTFSPENFKNWLKEIPKHPLYRQMKDSGLYISDPLKVSGGLAAKEEKFMTNLAQRIPVIGSVVRASERAYVSYLNKLRVDVFTQLSQKFSKEGIATAENLRSLSNFINNVTGRGDLGKLNRSAQVLNNVFFSPRLIAARFNMLNPVWYAKQTPVVRKEAIKTMAEFIGVGATVLGLAKAGGASVEIDPRSTDFGKIRIENTRWDIWGGFQQWVRVFSQLATKERKTAKGEVIPIDPTKFPFESRLDVAERFIRGKLAPIPALALELMEGQKLFGEKLSLSKELAENSIPLYLQDMGEAIREMGSDAIWKTGVPAFFGTGVQTYKEKRSTNRFNR